MVPLFWAEAPSSQPVDGTEAISAGSGDLIQFRLNGMCFDMADDNSGDPDPEGWRDGRATWGTKWQLGCAPFR